MSWVVKLYVAGAVVVWLWVGVQVLVQSVDRSLPPVYVVDTRSWRERAADARRRLWTAVVVWSTVVAVVLVSVSLAL